MHFNKSFLGLHNLIDSFFTHFPFFVLGAGVSVPLVPMTAEMSKSIVADFLDTGIFSMEPIESDNLIDRVILKPSIRENAMLLELLERIPPNFVRASILRLLTPYPIGIPPQYGIFNLSESPATIFSMNTDGLAREFCSGHLVLEPHGRVPTRQEIHDLDWHDVLLSHALYPNLPPLSSPNFIYPGPEPLHVTQDVAYKIACTRIKMTTHVAIIGYSFGGGFDDSFTYSFLMECLHGSHHKVIVVSPKPWDLVDRMSDSVRTNRIFGLDAYWKQLAMAMLDPGECKKSHLPFHAALCERCVWYRYAYFLDRDG